MRRKVHTNTGGAAALFRQPPEFFYTRPNLYISGRELEVTGRCRLLSLSREEVRLWAGDRVLCLRGRGLSLQIYSAGRIALRGTLEQVTLVPEGGKTP